MNVFGKEDGHQEMLKLMDKLLEAGRIEDMKRAIENKEYIAQLMKKLNMEEK
mgnify:FL=1